MNAQETVTVHQLLGRIVYFHTLFIEPSLTGSPSALSERPCCGHCQSNRVVDGSAVSLRDTAWVVLAEIAATLLSAQCPGAEHQCCPVCQVSSAGQAIAECWIDTERVAYARSAENPEEHTAWSRAIGVRLASAFALQHKLRCLAAGRADPIDTPPLPADQLPLTAELLALWTNPADHTPVSSWLNHCADITDIAHVLNTRRTSR